MDRTAWIAIALATIGLVASIVWEQRQVAEARVKYLQQQAVLAAQATPTPQAAPSPGPAASSNLQTQSSTDQKQREEQPEHDETLKSNVAELSFSNNKGGLVTVGLLNHRAEQGQLVQLNTVRTPAIGAIIARNRFMPVLLSWMLSAATTPRNSLRSLRESVARRMIKLR